MKIGLINPLDRVSLVSYGLFSDDSQLGKLFRRRFMGAYCPTVLRKNSRRLVIRIRPKDEEPHLTNDHSSQ
ncbi:hypothetical protein CEXT_674921 [Caerostris extrusa]|uniref:Uncharacterized protein n=1 Tax=Caerostris extrusa TaxID=172846 RepID=A0AAV4P7H5_CAEEX|nr:hypothetical protein CEXT_674921 [Caerostris extrusa]